jgi:uncharacterized protein (DUF1697 family)
MRYVALLRGINVGGRNLIKMPALKACFEAGRFDDVVTYIQSGNVLFSSPSRALAALTDQIESMLADAFEYVPTVVVRSEKQMRSVVELAPTGFGTDPDRRSDVIFLKEPLTAAAAMRHVPTKPGVDEAHPGTGVLYFSRLTAKATQTKLNRIVASPIYPSITIRNWNTTTKIAAMMSG